MDAGYIVFMQMDLGISGSMLSDITGDYGSALSLGIFMVSITMLFLRFSFSSVVTFFTSAIMITNLSGIASLIDPGVFGFEGAGPISADSPAGEGFLVSSPTDLIQIVLWAVLSAPVFATVIVLVPEIYKNWKGWFEFRVSLISLSIRFLYWKRGIRDPHVRVLVDLERMTDRRPEDDEK